MSGTLFLVGTPIGNLSDISDRCRETLSSADFIAAEDTRVTCRLLNHLGIKKPLVSYYEHNRAASGPRIIDRLLAGESCALVSDAGMPAISDPGEDLVSECARLGIPVSVVPGPCALISALTLSGLPTGRFTFEGFLSVNTKNRREHLAGLQNEERTMIFYEAPHKLLATLQDLSDLFGPDRPIALCRELTKLHEEILRTTLGQAVLHYSQQPPRGEFVLVVRGCEKPAQETVSLQEAVRAVAGLEAEGLSRRDAVRQVSTQTGIRKKLLYQAVQDGTAGPEPD